MLAAANHYSPLSPVLPWRLWQVLVKKGYFFFTVGDHVGVVLPGGAEDKMTS